MITRRDADLIVAVLEFLGDGWHPERSTDEIRIALRETVDAVEDYDPEWEGNAREALRLAREALTDTGADAETRKDQADEALEAIDGLID